jgi:hypothetical protein
MINGGFFIGGESVRATRRFAPFDPFFVALAHPILREQAVSL